jgi:hypothetical protein
MDGYQVYQHHLHAKSQESVPLAWVINLEGRLSPGFNCQQTKQNACRTEKNTLDYPGS